MGDTKRIFGFFSEIDDLSGLPVIKRVEFNTPAYHARLFPGDIIFNINGFDIEPFNMQRINELMKKWNDNMNVLIIREKDNKNNCSVNNKPKEKVSEKMNTNLKNENENN